MLFSSQAKKIAYLVGAASIMLELVAFLFISQYNVDDPEVSLSAVQEAGAAVAVPPPPQIIIRPLELSL